MTTASRRATTIWDGDLIRGRGTVTAKRAGSERPVSRALAAVDITVNATLTQPN